MVLPMTIEKAYILTRRRYLRPENDRFSGGTVTAFFALVICIRYLVNIYLSYTLCPEAYVPQGNLTTSIMESSRFFLRVNLSWCALWLCTIFPLIAYRGIARGTGGRRLGFLPLSRVHRLKAAFAAAFRGISLFLPLALGLIAWLITPVPIKIEALIDIFLYGALGLIGAAGILSLCVMLKASEQSLEFFELGLLVLLFVANPDLRIPEGSGRFILFNTLEIQKERDGLLFALPILGALLSGVLIFLSHLTEPLSRNFKTGTDVGLSLYLRRLPKAIFGILLILELTLITTNQDLGKTVRNLVIILCIYRLFWFIRYAVGLETLILQRLGAPKKAARSKIYRKAAMVHLLMSALPILVYMGMVVISR